MTQAISAVVLTLNEAANLERCLGSLAWCDEIVILDSGSSDGTPELATKLGARVLTHVQQGAFNIAEQRNWALDHADLKGTWVLFLDADEVVPVPLASELRRTANDPGNPFDAFELTPRYLFWGRWLRRTQGYPNWHARFLRRGNVRFSGGVWEHFADGARVGRISQPYDHYANSKGFSDWLRRHDRYSTWDAERIVEYLSSGNAAALGTNRKKLLRLLAAKAWPIRPLARFVNIFLLRRGFLEGIPGLVFSLQYTAYECMTVIKVVEQKRIRDGRPL